MRGSSGGGGGAGGCVGFVDWVGLVGWLNGCLVCCSATGSLVGGLVLFVCCAIVLSELRVHLISGSVNLIVLRSVVSVALS